MILRLYVVDLLLLGAYNLLLNKLTKQLMDQFEMTDMGDVSRVLDMSVTRGCKKGTITTDQRYYTEDVIERCSMKDGNPTYTPGGGPGLSLNQPEEKLLDKKDKKRYQSITCAVMYLEQVSRHIFFADNQLARAMSKPSKADTVVAKHLLRYLAGSANFSNTYKQGVFKLETYSEANWGNNPHNGKSMSSYIVMPTNGSISFKMGLQSLTT